MEPSDIFSAYRDPAKTETHSGFQQYFVFSPVQSADDAMEDKNLPFRTELTELDNIQTIAVDKLTKYITEAGVEIRIERQFFQSSNTITEDYSENGVLLHRTILEDGKFTSRLFYVFSREQLTKLIEERPDISIIYRQVRNNYRIDEYCDFINRVLKSKRIFVQNEKDELICFRYFRVEEGEVRSFNTDKYYYENGEEKFDFEYNPDGTCLKIYRSQSFQEDIFGKDIGTGRTDFTWKGFEYYQFAEPLVPET